MSQPQRAYGAPGRSDDSLLSPAVVEPLQDQPFDLGRALAELWRARWMVAGAALASALLAGAASLLSPMNYEAVLTLAVSPSKLGREVETLTPASFRPFIESFANADASIKELGLGKPPLSMTPTRFLDKALLVEEIRNTNLLRVRLRLPDPDLAVKAATSVAARAIATARSVNQDEAVGARDVIKGQLDEARQRLDDADTKLNAYRQEAQIELLRKDVESRLTQRGELLKLQVAIEGVRARLAAAEKEKASRMPVDTFRRSIDSEPALLEAARRQGASSTDLLTLQMRDEQANRVFEVVDEQVATSRTTLAGLERERAQLVGVRRLDAAAFPELTTLYRRESTLGRLDMEMELARKIYLEVAAQYEGARLLVASRSALLQVVDPPVRPDQPMSRRIGRNTLLGLVGGLTLAIIGVLLVAALRQQ